MANSQIMDKSIKILHLEDLPSDAIFIKHALVKAKIDYQGLVVDSKEKYIAALTEFSPDIILADHSLPSFNSIQALKILKHSGLEIPFIVITAAMSDESAVNLLMNGADDYILKDRLSRLPVAIFNALEKYHLIRERQKFLDELIISERRYCALIEHSADGLVILNAQGKSTYASVAVTNILGYSPKEVLDIDLFTLMHPNDIAGLGETFEHILASPGKTLKGHTGQMLHKGGSWRWIESTITNLLDDPAVNGIVVNFRDITEKKIAEDTIAESEEKYRLLFETSMDGILLTSQDGQVLEANQAACNIFKMTASEIIKSGGQNLVDVDDPRLSAVLEERLRTGKANGEVQLLRKDGSRFAGEVSSTVFINADGSAKTSMIVRDISQRKNAEQLLIESEQRLKQAQAIAKIGSWETDLRAYQMIWSEQMYEIFEKNADSFVPTHQEFLALIQQDDRLMVDHVIQGSIKDSSLNQIEHRINTTSGVHKTVEQRWTIFRDDQGLPVKAVGTCQDITEKKALERRLDRATTMARIGSFEADPVNDVLVWSPMTRQIHEVDVDFNPGIVTAMNFYKAGFDRDAIYRATDEIIKTQIPFDLELQIVTAKGNERWVRVMCEAELVNDKCILYGSFQDIDKIKKTESEVLRSFEEKNVILESIGDAFFAIDRDWVVNYWNKEAARLLGRSKNEVLNKNIRDVFPISESPESYTKYNQAVDSNQVVHFEDYYEPLDRWLEVSAYPSVNGLSVFFKDITERKLSEKQLNELNRNLQQYTNELALSNKGLEQFSYMVSHNLRAPVANIIGLSGLLTDESYPNDAKQDFLHGILDNVKRLDAVITDLNSILQVKREIGEKSETVDFQDLVDSIKYSIQNVMQKENVQILTHFDKVREMFTLKTYLYSIFHNLISNSIKYRQAELDPIIEISSGERDGKLTISFKDNGLGIDLTKRQDQVFGLYKRFHHHVEGKGMGLFMVKTQVEILGGTISVLSEINKGTEFLMEFSL